MSKSKRLSHSKNSSIRDLQAAKSKYSHRAEMANPYWNTVWQMLLSRGFEMHGRDFESWRDDLIKKKITPQQAEDYGWNYGTQLWWKELAEANVTNFNAWLVASGLENNQSFFGNHNVEKYVKDIIKWHNAGYLPGQISAWRKIGLRPEEVSDPTKPIIIDL